MCTFHNNQRINCMLWNVSVVSTQWDALWLCVCPILIRGLFFFAAKSPFLCRYSFGYRKLCISNLLLIFLCVVVVLIATSLMCIHQICCFRYYRYFTVIINPGNKKRLFEIPYFEQRERLYCKFKLIFLPIYYCLKFFFLS